MALTLVTPLFTTLLSLLKQTVTVFNLSISNSSIYDFKLAKSAFLAKSDVSNLVAFSKFAFVA